MKCLKLLSVEKCRWRPCNINRVQKAFESFGISVTDDEALEFQRLYAGNQKKLEISGGNDANNH